jgi:glucose/arabinose dehydrogenase
MSTRRCLLAFFTLLVVFGAHAAPPPVTLREVASGLAYPVEIAHAGDGSGRLFVVEVEGTIRIVKDGVVQPTAFLDLTERVASGGESGLLGLAFEPGYGSLAEKRFFVFYTMVDNSLRVSRFRVTAANPDLADPASEAEVITIPHPGATNHNGGKIAFGPDGYLYVGVGDGGRGGDPSNNAQNLTSLLGKLLRLDVDTPTGYLIPPDNPAYAGTPGARREIWAYGLRNPWRFSFDRDTGDLYIADVGQNVWEEIDYLPAASPGGVNFGWRVFEGDACFNPRTDCALLNHTAPILTYGRTSNGGYSVTGGYVYRGAHSAALRGYYIYGDYGSNHIFAAIREGGAWTSSFLKQAPNGIQGLSTFGEGEDGEVYVASFYGGKIFAIDGPASGAVINSPADGSTLTGASQLFTWTSAPGATLYQVWVGNSPGAYDIGYFPASGTTGTSLMIEGLPTDGRALHVRLWSLIGGVYYFTDRTYTAATLQSAPASIYSPGNGSTLGGSEQLFQWNDVGASLYQVWVGNTPGAYDIGYFPGPGTTSTSTLATGLPTDGRTLYVRLWSNLGGQDSFRDFTYTAANAGSPTPASITGPPNNSALGGSSQLFSWNDAGASLYQLWVGSAPGAYDYGYFPACGTTSTSTTATGLPTDGRSLYVRLHSLIDGTYYFRDFTYFAAP